MVSMRQITSLAVAGLAIAWSCAATTLAHAQAPATVPSIPANPQIEITNPGYVKPASPALVPIYERWRTRKVLETMAQFLAPLKLPSGPKLVVKFDECGGATTAAY